MIVDTHAHLQRPELRDDLDRVLERAHAQGVTRAIVVGTDLDSSRQASALAADHEGLHATAGIHPCAARHHGPGHYATLEELIRSGAFLAVGETGLDQHHSGLADRAEQLDGFHFQLDLARRVDLPVVIHCRKAFADVAACLREHEGVRGVLHCFSEGPHEQEVFLALGLHISFAGPVTRGSSRKLRRAAKLTPLDRLLVETDCPFLPPMGAGEGPNGPHGARAVAETLAELRGVPLEELAAATSRNAEGLFGLPR